MIRPILYTLPSKQTAAEIAVDILSHVMEQYFQPNDEAYITDVLNDEAAAKTVIKYARKPWMSRKITRRVPI